MLLVCFEYGVVFFLGRAHFVVATLQGSLFIRLSPVVASCPPLGRPPLHIAHAVHPPERKLLPNCHSPPGAGFMNRIKLKGVCKIPSNSDGYCLELPKYLSIALNACFGGLFITLQKTNAFSSQAAKKQMTIPFLYTTDLGKFTIRVLYVINYLSLTIDTQYPGVRSRRRL